MDGEVTKIPRETIMEILRDGCRAPSGDNTQPWRFEVGPHEVRIINTGDQQESVFNYRQTVNYLGIGACLENMRVSAEHHGYTPTIRLFPDPQSILVVASLTFAPAPLGEKSELFPYLGLRVSNRKKYKTHPVEEEKLAQLKSFASSEGVEVTFVTDPREIAKLANIVTVSEKLVIENRSVHDSFFKHITWNIKEDNEEHGFFIGSFEFTPPQKAVFQLFSKWSRLKFFLPLKVSDFIAKDAAKVYRHSAAFGAFITELSSKEAWVELGTALERLWLLATKLGLSLQVTTGLTFFAAPVISDEAHELTEEQKKLIIQRYGALQEVFSIKERQSVVLVFRLGYADLPSARTTRREPVVSFTP